MLGPPPPLFLAVSCFPLPQMIVYTHFNVYTTQCNHDPLTRLQDQRFPFWHGYNTARGGWGRCLGRNVLTDTTLKSLNFS